MNTSKLKFGHTFHIDSKILSGPSNDYMLTKSDTVFFTVELTICEGYDIKVFSELKAALDHSRHHNLVYRFVEYTTLTGARKISVIYNLPLSDEFTICQNLYGISGNWKLFINGKADIVAQHVLFPENNTTVRFTNFPSEREFYFHLSSLIYILTNSKLETHDEVRSAYSKVITRMKY